MNFRFYIFWISTKIVFVRLPQKLFSRVTSTNLTYILLWTTIELVKNNFSAATLTYCIVRRSVTKLIRSDAHPNSFYYKVSSPAAKRWWNLRLNSFGERSTSTHIRTNWWISFATAIVIAWYPRFIQIWKLGLSLQCLNNGSLLSRKWMYLQSSHVVCLNWLNFY